jgi:hypothetical protein
MLFFSSNTVRVTKTIKMRLAGHEVCSQGWELRTKFIVRKTAWSSKFRQYLKRSGRV